MTLTKRKGRHGFWLGPSLSLYGGAVASFEPLGTLFEPLGDA
jgi:hypothetical protein